MTSSLFQIYLKQQLTKKSPLDPAQPVSVEIGGLSLQFKLVSATPFGPSETSQSALELSTQKIGLQISDSVNVRLADSAPADDTPQPAEPEIVEIPQIHNELVNLLEFFLEESECAMKINRILVAGKAKSGKTTAIRWARERFRDSFHIETFENSFSLESPFFSKAKLCKLQPFLFFFDDVHKFAKHDLEKLTNLLQLIRPLQGVAICFADPSAPFLAHEQLDPKHSVYEAFRSHFDKEVRIGAISGHQRIQIVEAFLRKGGLEVTPAIRELIVQKTANFALGEVEQVIQELKFQKHRLSRQDSLSAPTLSQQVKSIFREMAPANFKSFAVETANTRWSDIGGYSQVKARIRAIVELPLRSPQTFFSRGILPSKGLLLYGPPGCSKTMFARAIASESNLAFLAVSGPEIFGKYVGQSEKKIRQLFQAARLAAPCVIFFDEIDAVATTRAAKGTGVHDRVLMQLLTEMDGVGSSGGTEVLSAFRDMQDKPGDGKREARYATLLESFVQNRVIVIAATNRPDVLDKAIVRPGRFDELVFVGLPDKTARAEILRIHMKGMQVGAQVEEQWLVARSKGYTGAEICQIVREAAMQSILEEAGLEAAPAQKSLFQKKQNVQSLFGDKSESEAATETEGRSWLMRSQFPVREIKAI